MTAFYKTFRRIGEQDGPIYRAIQYSKYRHDEIMKLCDTLEADYGYNCYTDSAWIVEDPISRLSSNGNIMYWFYSDTEFKALFVPATVDPWILSGGIDLSKCNQ